MATSAEQLQAVQQTELTDLVDLLGLRRSGLTRTLGWRTEIRS